MEKPDWNEYYKHTKHNPPRLLLVRAVTLLGRAGEALDLGCGAGGDTRYLLASGFQVTAVDSQEAALVSLADVPAEHLRLVQSTFEDFSFASYDLVNAQFALPFTLRTHFTAVFACLKTSLRPEGIFVGQFFGINDSWNTPESEMTFLSKEQVLTQLTGLEIAVFEEEEQDGISSSGPKHWHLYHIIARKP